MQPFLFLTFTGQLREERSLRGDHVRRGLSRCGYGSAVSGSAEGGPGFAGLGTTPQFPVEAQCPPEPAELAHSAREYPAGVES